MTLTLALCTWKLRVNKRALRKRAFLCKHEQINFTIRPSCGHTCQRISVLRDSPCPCHQSPCARRTGSIIWHLTASILPSLCSTKHTEPSPESLGWRRRSEKAVHPELPSVYGDASFFPSVSAFYVSSRKCPCTFVLWL